MRILLIAGVAVLAAVLTAVVLHLIDGPWHGNHDLIHLIMLGVTIAAALIAVKRTRKARTA